MSSKFTQIMRQPRHVPSPRSTLAPFAAQMRNPDPAVARQMARDAWQETGLLLMTKEWLVEAGFSYGDRMLIEAMGDRLHGKRKGERV